MSHLSFSLTRLIDTVRTRFSDFINSETVPTTLIKPENKQETISTNLSSSSTLFNGIDSISILADRMKTRSTQSVFEVPRFPVSNGPLHRRVLRSNSVSVHKENLVGNDRNSQKLRELPLRPLRSANNFQSISGYETPTLLRNRKRSSASLQATCINPKKRCCDSTRSSPALSPRVTRRAQLSTASVSSRVSRSLRSNCDRSSDSNSILDSEVTSIADDHINDISIFGELSFTSSRIDKAQKLKRRSNRHFELEEANISIDLDSSALNESRLVRLFIYQLYSQDQSLLLDPRSKLIELCKQTEIKSFNDFFDAATLENMVKIGEGIYGEVFQSPSKREVIKIFPVGGTDLVNGEEQMAFSDVYPEVFVSRKLTDLSFKVQSNRTVNFVQLKKATLVCGKLPQKIVEHWHDYAKSHGTDNECLDFLPETQEWVVLEFDYGGTTLANVRFNSCREARSVFEQVALSLAVAESALQFEHRDLHWLNILVRPTKAEKLRYKINGISYHVPTEGIQVTIIDFTVSRMCYDGNVVYVDLNDSPEIFECEGDYQYDIYRMMRATNEGRWRSFKPKSNLYWLHYLMGKLLNETSYPRRDPDLVPVESELRALYDTILSEEYTSTLELVSKNFYFDSCRVG